MSNGGIPLGVGLGKCIRRNILFVFEVIGSLEEQWGFLNNAKSIYSYLPV